MEHSDLVAIIRRRMERLKLNAPQLHQMLGDQVSRQTVYNFILHGKSARTDTLTAILNALGLTVVERDGNRAKVKRRKP